MFTCGQEMRDRIIGALEAGCRQGEMQKIQNGDIDWHSHEIKIAKAHTKASVARRIPVDPEGRLGEILGRRRFVGGPKGFVFGDATGAFVGDFNRLWRDSERLNSVTSTPNRLVSSFKTGAVKSRRSPSENRTTSSGV